MHDIFLHIQNYFVEIPVHDLLNPDVLTNEIDEAYEAFDSEVCHECLSLGTAMVIFIV